MGGQQQLGQFIAHPLSRHNGEALAHVAHGDHHTVVDVDPELRAEARRPPACAAVVSERLLGGARCRQTMSEQILEPAMGTSTRVSSGRRSAIALIVKIAPPQVGLQGCHRTRPQACGNPHHKHSVRYVVISTVSAPMRAPIVPKARPISSARRRRERGGENFLVGHPPNVVGARPRWPRSRDPFTRPTQGRRLARARPPAPVRGSSAEALGQGKQRWLRGQGLQAGDGRGHALHSHQSLDFTHAGRAGTSTLRAHLLRPLATLLLGAVVALTAAVAPLASSPAVHARRGRRLRPRHGRFACACSIGDSASGHHAHREGDDQQ